jgi:putative addiction module CopG family antidote
MNIALTPELEQFIQAQITDGTYATVNEVIEDSLRLLQAKVTPVSHQTQLKAELQKGIDDIEAGRYTTYTSGQDMATHIKILARQQQTSNS